MTHRQAREGLPKLVEISGELRREVREELTLRHQPLNTDLVPGLHVGEGRGGVRAG